MVGDLFGPVVRDVDYPDAMPGRGFDVHGVDADAIADYDPAPLKVGEHALVDRGVLIYEGVGLLGLLDHIRSGLALGQPHIVSGLGEDTLLRLDVVVVAVGDHNLGGPFVQLTLVSSSCSSRVGWSRRLSIAVVYTQGLGSTQ